ncbi:helix-turn-helix transcriptional regulator [Sporolactobacillus putidus]|uniref:Transcriptional regulator n=1 Tax=Sporolactobacillus putidus TaxID=492735 RepID=A0A917S8J8_9BACL|nr:WYL domain-containing protein [Sporolactobacillus putidus]GGL61811.1 transcriptional regulator [Sporolactobacillus putidus]
MRADRLLSILLILKAEGRTSARTLANQLEVSERTIFRDIDALSFSGFPIYAVRGSQGGFVLKEDFRIDLSNLKTSEVKELLINRFPGPLTDLGLGFNQISNKLISYLPKANRQQAVQFSKRLYLDPVQWFSRHDSVPCLTIIYEAIQSNQLIHIDYLKGNGEFISRRVEPLGLVAKTDCWYLVAKHSGILRVYRVSRIRNVEVKKETFLFPRDFELAHFWVSWCREFESSRPVFQVILLIDPAIVPSLIVDYGPQIQLTGAGKKAKVLARSGRHGAGSLKAAVRFFR